MSGRVAAPHTKRRTAACAAFVVLCAGVVGLAGAQPPQPPTKNELPKVDQNNPLPADAPRRQSPAKFAMDTNKAIFNRIEDFKPVASQAENRDEYDAWCEFVTHAKKFAAADLEQAAARDLTPIDLLKPNRSVYRCELLRFDGKMVCARRLAAPMFFRDNPKLGVTELYEVRLVPVDESPMTPVSVVFTELPHGLNLPERPQKDPVGAWVDVSGYVTAAGYYFKTMSVPGEQPNQTIGVPVLIAPSVTLLPAPPVPPGDDPTALDQNVRLYKFIKDEAPMIRNTPTGEQWAEVAAENRVLLHASRFPAEELEKHARDDLKFADLFTEGRQAYKLQNVKFEGRLISLKKMAVARELEAAGVGQAFEGWLVPANEPRGNPICIVFTEPLPGVEPVGRVNKWVSFAGYSFKKMRYVSSEEDPKNPAKNVEKYAPLLIGKGAVARPERDPDRPSQLTWGGFVLAATIVVGLLIVAGGALTLYYRKGDRRAKESMDAVRNRNPFDAATTAPPPTA
jgi:hypothetical protein